MTKFTTNKKKKEIDLLNRPINEGPINEGIELIIFEITHKENRTPR